MSSTKEERWFQTESLKPTKGQKVDWMMSTGEIVKSGTYQGLWMLPNSEVYVYYTPRYWRPATNG